MLECLGFSEDFLDEEIYESLLGIAINQGKVYHTHYKDKYYINSWLDWMQISAHIVREGNRNIACNSDVHVPGGADTFWTCKIVSKLDSFIKDDPLEKRVMITNKEGTGLAVLNLVNGDLLPSCDEKDEITVQVIGKAYTLKRYETEEDCNNDISISFNPQWKTSPSQKSSQFTIGNGALLPLGLLAEHHVDINNPLIEKEHPIDLFSESISIARGKLLRACTLKAQIDGKILSRFLSVEIENDSYGVLALVASYDCMSMEELKKLKPGDIIYAECILSGDALYDDTKTKLPLSHEHNIRVIKSAFRTGDFDRLWGVLSEDCFYRSESANVCKVGRDNIIDYLKSKQQLMADAKQKNNAFIATATSAPVGFEFRIGQRCVVISHGNMDNIASIAFIMLNAENQIERLILANPRKYQFQFDDN